MRWLVIAFAFVVGCEQKQKQTGLPPAQEWGADPGAALAPAQQPPRTNPHVTDPSNPHAGMGGAGGDPSNPHAGMDPSNPHAGLDMNSGDTSNPHAGLDMGGAANPHAGLDMNGGGTDVAKLGLPPPDPNRPIDPTHHIKGVIKIHPKAADRAKPNGAVFVIVKRADASGAPTGTPLAVDKLTWQKDELAFEITEQNAMIAGTQLTGDVVIMARYDQDGDALSKQPGDISGQMRVTIPAESVKLYLDQVLP